MSNVSHDEWEDAAAPSARGCGGRSRHADGIVFHKDKAGTNPVRFSLRVRVGADIMKATRWLTGDRMWLQISKARDKLRISRTTDGVRGWKLLGTNTAKPASGASCTAYFKATVSEDVLAALFPDELDYIAAAMAGEVANQSERNGFYKPPFDGLAERCYDMADAMMMEREKGRAE